MQRYRHTYVRCVPRDPIYFQRVQGRNIWTDCARFSWHLSAEVDLIAASSSSLNCGGKRHTFLLSSLPIENRKNNTPERKESVNPLPHMGLISAPKIIRKNWHTHRGGNFLKFYAFFCVLSDANRSGQFRSFWLSGRRFNRYPRGAVTSWSK